MPLEPPWSLKGPVKLDLVIGHVASRTHLSHHLSEKLKLTAHGAVFWVFDHYLKRAVRALYHLGHVVRVIASVFWRSSWISIKPRCVWSVFMCTSTYVRYPDTEMGLKRSKSTIIINARVNADKSVFSTFLITLFSLSSVNVYDKPQLNL